MTLRGVRTLAAVLLTLTVLQTLAAHAQTPTETAGIGQPQAIDAAGKKRPKTMGRPARDKIKNKKIKQALEYDVTGGDTLVSTTEFDKHGNALRKHHKGKALESTEVDTTRDVITKHKDERYSTEMAFEYGDEDTALRVIRIKHPNRPDTKLTHDYDANSRLIAIASEVPTDTVETGPRGRTNTAIQYDGDSDNVTEIAVTGTSDPALSNRMISRVQNTYDLGRLVRQDFHYNAKVEGPDSIVVTSVKTYAYTPAGLLARIETADPANPANLIVETHAYDSDENEIKVEYVAPFTRDDGTVGERKTVTTRTLDDGLLTREVVEEFLDGVLTTSRERRIVYEK